MDKLQARAAQVWLDISITTPDDPPEDIIEAALTAAHDAGWDEAIEAAEITVVPSIHLGEAQVAKVREKIRRLRKGKVKAGGE